MSPFRSSAGPGDAADAHAELLADDVREARLAEPRRPDEQDVVERLLAGLRRLERDVELLLDPLLADELVERARAERALDLVVLGLQRRREELLGHAAFSACRTRSSGGSLGIGRRQRALGLERRVAELDERVARDEVGDAPSGTTCSSPSFSFSSSTTRSAVFFPTPGMAMKRAVSPRTIDAPKLGRRRAGDDQQRDLRPHAGDRQQLLEELALGGLGEAVELEHVLAHVRDTCRA